MHGYHANIEKLTLANDYFRKVLYTTKNSQLVLMSLAPGEDIGEEVHDVDQFFRFEQGDGQVIINGNIYEISHGDTIIVPAGNKHNVINKSNATPLKLYTIYSPPHHRDQTVHQTKVQAQQDHEHFDGQTSG